MIRSRVRGALLAVSIGLLCACQSKPADNGPAPAPASTPNATTSISVEWDQAVEQFIAGFFDRYPTFAANAGKHEYDGKLPDYSQASLDANALWLHEQRNAITAFGDDRLDATQRFQREYVTAVIDGQLFTLEESGFPYNNPLFYGGDFSPSMYLTRPYAPLAQRMAAFVGYQEALPKAIEQMRANMRTPLPKSYIELGRDMFAGYSSFFADDVPGIFAEIDDADLQARLKASNAAAIKATRDMADWYIAQLPNATQDFALGAEKFSHMLYANERVNIPLDTLKAIGEADLERNLAALKSACDAFAPGKSIEECMHKQAQLKPKDGAVEEARRQLVDLRKFVIDKDLVTIPGNEEALVAEAPPFNRSNFAYIEIPGPYEKNLPSTYYIAPPDPTWSQAEQDAYIPARTDLLFTSVHEVWPGHFLHFLHVNRSNWIFGRLFAGYAYTEGWAHYTEEMMFDAGLEDSSPEAHIGQLSNALLRNVRFVSAIGMHTGGMSMEESERLFREKAYQDPGNARQQASRGTWDPGYLNYTMGKLMIMQLREDWTARHGGRQGWKAFHDAFLAFGGPPIPLVRAQMLGGKAEAVLWQPATASKP